VLKPGTVMSCSNLSATSSGVPASAYRSTISYGISFACSAPGDACCSPSNVEQPPGPDLQTYRDANISTPPRRAPVYGHGHACYRSPRQGVPSRRRPPRHGACHFRRHRLALAQLLVQATGARSPGKGSRHPPNDRPPVSTLGSLQRRKQAPQRFHRAVPGADPKDHSPPTSSSNVPRSLPTGGRGRPPGRLERPASGPCRSTAR
jgi:hypothetical protein